MVDFVIDLFFQVNSFLHLQFNSWQCRVENSYCVINFCATISVHLSGHEYCSQMSISQISIYCSPTYTVGCTTNFVTRDSIGSLLFKISCITTSSFSTVQAGCVEAGKIIEEDYNHSHGISTRITEEMSYSLYRLSHGIITYLLGFWQLY